MSARSGVTEKTRQANQTLNDNLGRNLRRKKSGRGWKTLRLGLASGLALAAVAVVMILAYFR